MSGARRTASRRRGACWIAACLLLLGAPARAEDDGAADPGARSLLVLDGRGRPLAGAEAIVLGPRDGEAVVTGDETALAVSDRHGRLVVPGQAAAWAATGRLAVRARQHAPVRVPAGEANGTVRLLRAVGLGGRLTRAGVALGEVAIQARTVPERGALVHQTTTGADGTYRLERLHAGVWRLAFQRTDGQWQGLGLARAGEVHDLEAGLGGELLVTLRADPAAAGPVEGVRVDVVAADGLGARRSGVSEATGRLVVGDLPEGAYEVHLEDLRWAWTGPRPRVVIERPGIALAATWTVAPRRVVTGRVLDAARRPVAGARVTPLDAGSDPQPDEVLRLAATTTADGRFALAGVRDERPFRLVVTAPSQPPWLGPVHDLSRRVQGDLGDLVLERGTSLVVRVSGPDGRAPEGVLVELAARAARLAFGEGALDALRLSAPADGGEARFEGVPVEDLLLLASAPGWTTARVVIDAATVRSGRPVRVDLSRAVGLSGRVVTVEPRDRRRGPFVVVARPVDEPAAWLAVRTADDGRFAFESLRGVAHRLEAHADTGPALLPLGVLEGVVPGAEDAIEIPLAPRAAIEGTVTGLDRRGAVPELLVAQPLPRDDADEEGPRFRTVLRQRLEAGRVHTTFRVEGMPSGVYALRVRQGARLAPPQLVVVREDDVEDVELDVPEPAGLAVRIVDARHGGLVGVRVRVHPDEGEEGRRDDAPPTRSARDLAVEGATDERGDVVFEHLAAGRWRLCIDDARQAPAEQVVDLEPGESRVLDDIVLGAGGRLVGRVEDGNGLPVDGALVSVRQVEGTAPARRVRSRPDGSFVLDHVAPGPQRVGTRTGLDGSAWRDVVVDVRDDEETEVVLGPVARVVVHGQVVRGGTPVPGAQLTLEVRDPDGDDAAGRAQWRTATGVDGRYRFEHVGTGPAVLALRVDSTRSERRLRLAEHDERVVDFEVHDGRVLGRVVDADGRPVLGAFLEARRPGAPDGAPVLASGETDARGRFRLIGLPLQDVDLRATALGLPPGRAYAVRPEPPGGDEETVVTLGRGGTLRVVVVDELGRGVPYAEVQLLDGDGLALLAWPRRTAAFGRLVLPGIPEGHWSVLASRRGLGTPPAHPAEVREGLETELEIVLPPPARLLVQVVGDGPEGVARARVGIVRAADGRVLVEGRRPRRRLPGGDDLPSSMGAVGLEDLAPGVYVVLVRPGPRDDVLRSEVHLKEGEEAIVEIDLLALPR